MIPAVCLYTEPEHDHVDPGPSPAQERAEAMRLYGPEARDAYVTRVLADADWHHETARLASLLVAQARLGRAICGDGSDLADAIAYYRVALRTIAQDEARLDPDGNVAGAAWALWLGVDE